MQCNQLELELDPLNPTFCDDNCYTMITYNKNKYTQEKNNGQKQK